LNGTEHALFGVWIHDPILCSESQTIEFRGHRAVGGANNGDLAGLQGPPLGDQVSEHRGSSPR
jgi:hypothetical protein